MTLEFVFNGVVVYRLELASRYGSLNLECEHFHFGGVVQFLLAFLFQKSDVNLASAPGMPVNV